jgi:glycosyltransferase involved in cell wall biosynthesis
MTCHTAPIRILVPYMRAYGGGVRRLLGDGLPQLARLPQLDVQYAELCQNESDLSEMERTGVSVDRMLGVRGSGILSHSQGVRRAMDLLAAIPRLAHIVWRLRTAIVRYDVLYVHGYRELFLGALALRMVSRYHRPALVWHCHGLGDGQVPFLLPRLARRCRYLIAVSNDVVRGLQGLKIHGPHVRQVYNALDVAKIQHQATHTTYDLPEKITGQKTLLIASACLRADKGADVVVRALGRLPTSFVLWITGDTQDPPAAKYKQELDRLINEFDLGKRVFYIGARTDIYAVMKAADMVIVPSRVRESFGFAAAEPMAMGIPVAVSNRGALPEVVDFGRCGRIFDPDQDDTLADCVRKVFADPATTASQVNAGLKRVENVFSYARWSDEVAQVLQSSSPGETN